MLQFIGHLTNYYAPVENRLFFTSSDSQAQVSDATVLQQSLNVLITSSKSDWFTGIVVLNSLHTASNT